MDTLAGRRPRGRPREVSQRLWRATRRDRGDADVAAAADVGWLRRK